MLTNVPPLSSEPKNCEMYSVPLSSLVAKALYLLYSELFCELCTELA